MLESVSSTETTNQCWLLLSPRGVCLPLVLLMGGITITSTAGAAALLALLAFLACLHKHYYRANERTANMPSRRRKQLSSGSAGTVRATSAYAHRVRSKQNSAKNLDSFWHGIDEAEYLATASAAGLESSRISTKKRVKQVSSQTAQTTSSAPLSEDDEGACPRRPVKEIVFQVNPEPPAAEEQKPKKSGLFRRMFKGTAKA